MDRFEVNPGSVRFYRCDRCGRRVSVTVIVPAVDDNLCECGGRFAELTEEMSLSYEEIKK